VALGKGMIALHRILVATDFSTTGHAAVARAGQLAAQHHCELMVLHATPDWTLFSERAGAHQQHYADITRNAEELMRGEVNWLGHEYGLTTARGDIHQDRAAAAISRAIESFQPDLLVVGAGGEHMMLNGETVLGGTALKLLSRVAVPLLVVRNSSPVPYTSTLAAVGGDMSTARRVTHWASALVGSGTCHAVRAYDAPYANRMRLCRYDDAEIAHAADEQCRLAQQDCEAMERTLDPGRHLTVHTVCGAPLPSVLRQVKQCAPQLVVIGRHQHRTDEHPGAWAAGLGTRIAYHCATDVLMIP
jgi:nucleotide-binding universal stress UspA family protein